MTAVRVHDVGRIVAILALVGLVPLGPAIAVEPVQGGPGDDSLFGTAQRDRIVGYGGDDTAHARAGSDAVLGYAGDDTLWLGRGNDSGWGSSGDNEIHGGAGADSLSADEGRSALWGGTGRDSLSATGGRSTIHSGPGSDQVYSLGVGGGHIFLGAGGDSLHIGPNDSIDTVDCGAGFDVVTYVGDVDLQEVLIACEEVAVQAEPVAGRPLPTPPPPSAGGQDRAAQRSSYSPSSVGPW